MEPYGIDDGMMQLARNEKKGGDKFLYVFLGGGGVWEGHKSYKRMTVKTSKPKRRQKVQRHI